jgi:hypothetical protein
MSSVFSGPKVETAAATAPVPTRSAADVRKAQFEERQRFASSAGRASTNLTGGQGAADTTTPVVKTLLGQA